MKAVRTWLASLHWGFYVAGVFGLLFLLGLFLLWPQFFLSQSTFTVRQTGSRQYNVLWIVSDSLRADHTSLEGYRKETTPNLEALSEDAINFTNYRTNAPFTTASTASYFTSLYPAQHGATQQPTLSDRYITIAEILRKAGYYTAGFSNNYVVSPYTNFNQGFDDFFAAQQARGGTPEQFTGKILDDFPGESPFFLYVHYMDPHRPYRPLKPWSEWGQQYPTSSGWFKTKGKPDGAVPEHERQEIMHRYDQEIRGIDHYVNQLVERLKREGLYRETVILFTSDHGEEFYDHGGWGHGPGRLWVELLDVPLLIKPPKSGKQKGIKSSLPLESVDLVPTLLGTLGFQVNGLPYELEGEDFLTADGLPDTGSISSDRIRLAQTSRLRPEPNMQLDRWLWSLKKGSRKLLSNPLRTEEPSRVIFDHDRDPREQSPRYDFTEKEQALFERGNRLTEKHLEEFDQRKTKRMKEGLRKRLKNLGYL